MRGIDLSGISLMAVLRGYELCAWQIEKMLLDETLRQKKTVFLGLRYFAFQALYCLFFTALWEWGSNVLVKSCFCASCLWNGAGWCMIVVQRGDNDMVPVRGQEEIRGIWTKGRLRRRSLDDGRV